MGKDTVIVLSDGSEYKLTKKAINFIEDLNAFCAKRGIPEEKIPEILAELSRRELARANGAVDKDGNKGYDG